MSLMMNFTEALLPTGLTWASLVLTFAEGVVGAFLTDIGPLRFALKTWVERTASVGNGAVVFKHSS